MASLAARISKLESRLNAHPMRLFFDDGTEVTLAGNIGKLLGAAVSGESTLEQMKQLDLIRRSTRSSEDGLLIELTKSLLLSPDGPPETEDPPWD